MSKIILYYPPGSTPLDPNEKNGLIPDYITTQEELNELEQKNIIEAMNWLYQKKHGDILNVSFLLELHKKMFERVWKWAGQPRQSNKNIGAPREQIMGQLGVLLMDTQYWIENTTYIWEEIATRFHYRLVAIHIFANGNGRHARLMTDILLEINGKERFTWGSKTHSKSIEIEGPVRESYIAALKKADTGDYDALLLFAKS